MMLLPSTGGNRVPVIAKLVQADEDTVCDVIHRFNEIGTTAVHHRELQSPQPHRADPGPARLPAMAQHQRPPSDILAAQRRERARVRREKGIRWGARPALAS